MLLELKNIRKRFGGVTALTEGNLAADSGEVHLLLGENGPARSTLMKIVAGMYERDGGEMLWRGRPVPFEAEVSCQQKGSRRTFTGYLLTQTVKKKDSPTGSTRENQAKALRASPGRHGKSKQTIRRSG